MGICLCDKHGRVGIAVVCRHVSELVSRGRYGRFHRLRVLGEDVFCGDCFHATGLHAVARARSAVGAGCSVELGRLDAALEAYTAAIERLGQQGTTAHCAECVAAAEVTQARMDGRPDPFPVFERTMTSHHGGALSELRSTLAGELASRESVPRIEAGPSPSVSVCPGTYRQPLTVCAYRVVTAAAQDHVIGLVSAFLAGRDLDQARVEFYEAEVWATTGLGLRCRGEEVLLRRALLNCRSATRARPPGSVILRPMAWVLDEEIGHGALGRVVRVRHQLTGEVLAGKILHASNRDDAGAVARFGREAELLHSIDHPNLVDVRGLEVIEGEQVLLMELIEGPSLAQLIAREDVLPEARVVAIGKGIAAGLQAAHRAGLVHRDLKPANVLIGPGDVAKIVDFGLARATSFAGVDRRSLALVGTPDYMAPESADPLAIDPRSDLYSLGCILFEMMTGRPPYGGATPFAVLQAHIEEPLPELEAGPERSEGLVRLVRALLAKSPADRPQSAAQVAQDLAAVHGLAAVVAGALARAGACARCGAPLIDDVPVCFGCAMEQGTVEAGPGTVWVTGPGKNTHKLDSGLREKLLDWMRSSPQLGLDASQLEREVPRLPFVLVAGVSEASARRLVSSVTALGLTAEWRAGHRFSLLDMRRKAWSLSGRILAIAAGTMAIFNQMLRIPGVLIVVVALVPVAAVASGWRMAGRAASRLRGETRGALPPALRERIDRLVELVPAIEARRHRESLRGAVQRVLALRASVPEAERARIEPELAHVLDLAMAAAARIDELERRLAVADLRETDAAARKDLRERDAWAARLLETSAQLDALRARWAAARATDSEADRTLDQLRAQVAAFEEVEAL